MGIENNMESEDNLHLPWADSDFDYTQLFLCFFEDRKSKKLVKTVLPLSEILKLKGKYYLRNKEISYMIGLDGEFAKELLNRCVVEKYSRKLELKVTGVIEKSRRYWLFNQDLIDYLAYWKV